MNLKFSYWYFKDALPHKVCSDILKLGLSKTNKSALVGNSKNKDITDKKIRNSNIAWLDERWIYKAIHPYVYGSNQNSGWNFEWSITENCQFTIYKKGQFYDWHQDSHFKPYDSGALQGKIRKLSMTILLNDAKEFKGGDFLFDLTTPKDKKKNIIKVKELTTKGSVIVFPSFLWHKVEPVTKGTRYSLVVWNCGNPWQ
jgi:PKHD-type hydroxylase